MKRIYILCRELAEIDQKLAEFKEDRKRFKSEIHEYNCMRLAVESEIKLEHLAGPNDRG